MQEGDLRRAEEELEAARAAALKERAEAGNTEQGEVWRSRSFAVVVEESRRRLEELRGQR